MNMNSTHSGLVIHPPGPLPEKTFFGEKFMVGLHQIAVLDLCEQGRQPRVEIFGHGGPYEMDKPWFRDRRAQLTILSTGDQILPFSEEFGHKIEKLGKEVRISIVATMHYHLVESAVKAALTKRLELNPAALNRLELDLKDYVREAFGFTLQELPLPSILETYRRGIAIAIKRRLDARGYDNGGVLREFGIEFTKIEIASISSPAVPVVPLPPMPFVIYEGPLELSNDCVVREQTNGELELKFKVRKDTLAVLPDVNLLLKTGEHSMRHLATKENIVLHQENVVIMNLSDFALPLDFSAKRFFELIDGSQVQSELKVTATLYCQINRSKLDVIQLGGLVTQLDNFQGDIVEVCGGILSLLSDRVLQTNTLLPSLLRKVFLEKQPFEQKYGISITGLLVHNIQGIPGNVRMIGLELPPGEPVRLMRMQDLLDPTAERLQLPSGTMAVTMINGKLGLLRSGPIRDYQSIPPYQEVTVVDTREFEPVHVSHQFPMILPTPHGEAALDFGVEAAISCSAVTNRDDEESLDKLKQLWTSREKYEKWIELRTKRAITAACSAEGLAVVQRNKQSIEQAIAVLLAPDLEEKGLVLNSVVVTKIDFPKELFERVMTLHHQHILSLEHIAEERRKFLSAQMDANAQREYAQKIPALSLSLLMRNDPQALREFLNNAVETAGLAAERSASGAEGRIAIEGIINAIGQLPSATPPPPKPSNVDDVIQNEITTTDQSLRDALRASAQVAIPLPEQTAGPSGNAPTLTPEVVNAIEECRTAVPQVRVIVKGDTVAMTVTLPDARIRLTLRDWEDYPDAEPIIAKFVTVTGESEERAIKPELKSLTRWHLGSSLTDVARELVERGAELIQ